MSKRPPKLSDPIQSASTSTATMVASRYLTLQKETWATILYGALVILLLCARWTHFPSGLSSTEVQAALVIVFTLGAWAFGALDEPLPTFAFFLLVILFKIAPPEVIFSGFTSTAWWLVLGGSAIGLAVKSTGIATRIAAVAFSTRRGTYNQYVIRVALLSVAMAFLMPSTTGRIMLLTPIVLALAESLGYERGSTGHTGLILTLAATSYMPPTAILPANLPNSVLLGAVESQYGIKLSYGAYLLLHFPVLGLLKSAAIVWAIVKLFPEQRPCKDLNRGGQHPLSSQERRLLSLLCLSVMLFATDFIHGISPAWISLATAIACLWPSTRVLSTKAFSDGVHVTPLIYVAGFLGLGALVASSGIGTTIGQQLLHWTQMSPGDPLKNLGILTLINIGMGLLTTLPSLPAVMTPLAHELAQASGFPLYTVLMLQVPVFGMVLLPYQCPPMVIAMGMGGVSIKDGTKLCLAVAGLSVLVLAPLDLAWWKVMGLL